MNKNIIIVTAFIDIGRGNWTGKTGDFKRSAETYLSYFEKLATLENEIIIFTTKEYVAKIKEIRGDKPTVIIEFDIHKKLKYTIKKVQKILDSVSYQNKIPLNLRDNPEYQIAEYVVLMNLKYYFMNQVQKIIPKAIDDILAWVDFGYCRRHSVLNGATMWNHPFENNFIHLFSFKKSLEMKNEDVMLQKALHNDAYFIGGVMVGSVKSWRQFYLLTTSLQKKYLRQNICDDDQGTLLMAFWKQPELFKIHKIKGWFSVFRKYNKGSKYRTVYWRLKSSIIKLIY